MPPGLIAIAWLGILGPNNVQSYKEVIGVQARHGGPHL